MKRILLDTNIIIQFPKLLGIKKLNTIFVITTAVMNELVLKTKFNAGLSDLVDQANRESTVEIIGSNSQEIQSIEATITASGLSRTDQNLLASALYYQGQSDEVSICTTDIQIRNYAKTLKLNLTTRMEVKQWLEVAENSVSASTLGKKIRKYEFTLKQNFRIQLIIGTLAWALSHLLQSYGSDIVKNINVWGIIVALFLAGIGLFIIRERWRLTYGVFEFFFGFATIVYIFWPVFDYTKIKELDIDIKLAGGLYIMVRGQDNIVKALRGTKPGVFLAEKLKLGL